MKRVGLALLALVSAFALLAPVLAPNDPDKAFRDFLFAPPSRVYLRSESGAWVAPYTYPLRLVSRLERRYEEDRSRPVPLQWFRRSRFVSLVESDHQPLLLLGADAFGRDILARLLYGARTSLALALLATAAAILIGLLIGGLGGYAGGVTDEVLARLSDFVLVLPAIYIVLALRSVLPLVLSAKVVFTLMVGIFALVGWPFVARGVRAIIASEKHRDYAQAARAVGAGHARTLVRHLMPATVGFLAVQATLLLPGFILAEATLSYVGLGFPDSTPTWGTMLHDASNVAVLADVPWALAPAVAIFVVALAVNLVVQAAPSSTPLRARPSTPLRAREIPVDRPLPSVTIPR
jgi:peptide/nickel transport system permease protein